MICTLCVSDMRIIMLVIKYLINLSWFTWYTHTHSDSDIWCDGARGHASFAFARHRIPITFPCLCASVADAGARSRTVDIIIRVGRGSMEGGYRMGSNNAGAKVIGPDCVRGFMWVRRHKINFIASVRALREMRANVCILSICLRTKAWALFSIDFTGMMMGTLLAGNAHQKVVNIANETRGYVPFLSV